MDAFLISLDDILNKLKVENTNCYLMGDYNVNLLNCESHPQTNEFIDLMYSFSFHPLIDKPTRITSHSSTLIDNIFINRFKDHNAGILYTDVSDHFPIFAIDKVDCDIETNLFPLTFRRVNDRLTDQFNEILANKDWTELYSIDSSEDGYTHFMLFIQNAYNQTFPLTETRQKRKKDKPWITSAIRNSIRVKNKLYKQYHRIPTVYNEIRHKTYKRVLKKLIEISKKQHYNLALVQHKGNLKQTWRLLKEVIGVPNKKDISKTFKVNHKTLTEPSEIANHFNEYFVNVGDNLAKNIPPSHLSPLRHVKKNDRSIFLAPVVEQEIANCISHIKDGSSGHDSIKPSVIKKCKTHLLRPLAHIFNLSISEGRVPTPLKYAYITPVFKTGDQTSVNNYRPISVLPVFSKLLERLIFNRTYSFILNNDILSDQQFGFRKKLSTEMALLSAIDRITKAIEDKKHTIGLFIDLKKAFDTVNIRILLAKLNVYGIRGNALSWFESYLSNRTQSVKYCNNVSSALPVTLGVPQGSILGPLLFILYVNDMPNVFDSVWPIIFADDTTLFVSSKTIDDALQTFNDELSALVHWFNANKLSLNLSKTHYMVFTTSPQVRATKVDFNVDNNPINQVTKTKFLGVVIDDQLRWCDHIDHVCTKVRKSLGIIKRASKILNADTLKSLYYTMIFPYLNYCHLVWGKASASQLKRITNLQKRAIRVISSEPWLAHTHPLFLHHKIIKFEDLYTYLLSLFTYKYVYRMFPLSFRRNININVNSISSNTLARRTTALLPLCRTNIRKNTISYQCPNLCNNLIYPLSLPPTISYFSFKKLIISISL